MATDNGYRTAEQASVSIADERAVAVDGLFGWLHLGVDRRGVILCGTHGYEQACAHRAWRGLAHAVAATGATTFRFDYRGEGDSADTDAARPEAWLSSIRTAVRFLRDTPGIEEIVLIGLRLGGTLAAVAAADEAVDRLILLAPFATDRTYAREMKLQARAINLLPDGGPSPSEPGTLNVGGYHLEAALLSGLSCLDLAAAVRAPAPRILVMGNDAAALGGRYAALGSDVTTADFPDLAGLVADPLMATMTQATTARIVAYATANVSPSAVPGPWEPPGAEIGGDGWSEAPCSFGPGIFGIECRPTAAAPSRASVLFLNLGAIVHFGHGRQTTVLARRLARVGVASLRMDLLGVGDSADRASGGQPFYNLETLDDIRAAVGHLADRHAGPIVLAGTCNGAYLAFHALCRDERIAGAVLANLYCFDWDITHDGVPFLESPVRSTTAYVDLLKQREAWRRLLTGRTPVMAIMRGIAHRGLQRLGRAISAGIGSGKETATIKDRIARLRARGARLALIYSAGDLGLADVRVHLGASTVDTDQLLGTPIHILDRTDHILSSPDAQTVVFDSINSMIASPKGHEPQERALPVHA